MASKKNLRRLRIKRRVRKSIFGTAERPRLSVHRSNTGIYAQLIDDNKGHTLTFASSKEFSDKRSVNAGVATEVGKRIADKAKSLNLTEVVFDRNGYLYHGKVKALADGAREGGLKF